MNNIDLQLDFLKRVLTDTVDEDIKNEFFSTHEFPPVNLINSILHTEISNDRKFGMDWPENGHTMIGMARLDNLHQSLNHIRLNNINGDFLEAGVWKGGACIFMQMYNKLYNMHRKIYVCDSFMGMPETDLNKYPLDVGTEEWKGTLSISQDEVIDNFKLYDALQDNVIFLPGWFSDTLTTDLIGKLSLLRLDGDMYSSTMNILDPLYPKVEKNGIVIADDFIFQCCVNAVKDYMTKNNIPMPTIYKIDYTGVFWVKQ